MFTPALDLVWHIAASEADYANYEYIEPTHLFIGLCKLEAFLASEELEKLGTSKEMAHLITLEVETLQAIFADLNFDPIDMRRNLRMYIGNGSFITHTLTSKPRTRTIHRSPQSRAMFARASDLAYQMGVQHTATYHLLAALLENPSQSLSEWLSQQNLNVTALQESLLLAITYSPPARQQSYQETYTHQIAPTPNMLLSPVASPLETYGTDLTRLAREGLLLPVIGRKHEMLQVVRTLSRTTKNNPLLLGDPGVGKTAVVEGLAWRIAHGNVPDTVKHTRIIQLNIADLVAGTSYRGEFEERMQEIIRDVQARPDIILFIDEIHTLVGTGNVHGAMDAANILKPALARGTLRCIGATTYNEYRKHIERDAALERRFQPITVKEPDKAQTFDILMGLRLRFESQHQVTIHEETLHTVVNLSIKYLPDRYNPDKAIDLLDEACARTRITHLTTPLNNTQKPHKNSIVDSIAIADVIAEWTGIPLAQFTNNERSHLLTMEKYLKQRVIGQDQAITSVVQTVQRSQTGLKSSSRPIGVLLFIGPSGVGKTYLAQTTASFMFGSDQALTRLDMSEFMQQHAMARLVGAPPGYVGYEDEGQIITILRRKPYGVMLLDEVDKAHPDILNLFLQLFDEGRISDAKGRTVDATNTLFIMTANRATGRSIGLRPNGSADERLELDNELKTTFNPELLNRIDDVVLFQPLQPDHITSIAHTMLNDLTKRLAEQHIELHITTAARDMLVARSGVSPDNGARSLQGAIARYIEQPLSQMLLRGDIATNQHFIVDVRENDITIEEETPGEYE